ncbi:acyl-CoA desaturase [Trinickia caryophylli]
MDHQHPHASSRPVQLDDRTGITERRLAWLTVGIPTVGAAATVALAIRYGVGRLEIGLLASMYLCTALGVEAGLHRFFSHQAFKAGPIVTALFAIFGSMAAQGPVLFWAATHRMHHAFTDQEGDPHSPRLHGSGLRGRLRGMWHAHVGWLFTLRRQNWSQFTPDLLRDRWIVQLNRLYFAWIALGLALPAAAGWLIGGTAYSALMGFLWGGLMRIFLVDQATWAINSFAHSFGPRPNRTRDASRNVAWLALPAVGGGWHNNHHAFPALARTGQHFWQLDISGSFIELLALLGLVWDVRRPERPAAQAAQS